MGKRWFLVQISLHSGGQVHQSWWVGWIFEVSIVSANIIFYNSIYSLKPMHMRLNSKVKESPVSGSIHMKNS